MRELQQKEKIKALREKPIPMQTCLPQTAQISLSMNLSLHSDRPVANHLSHGMALVATLFAGN